jgi:gamma-polyglutamate biosynthesis protein CapA
MNKRIILNAVGDVWFGDHPVVIGHGINSTGKKLGVNYFFKKVTPLFRTADIVFCNLETVLSEKGLKKYYLPSVEMRGFPECVNALKSGGFNLVNVANNHIAQHGLEAFYDTLRILTDNEIQYIGLDSKQGSIPFIFNKDGFMVAFLGYSMHPEQYFSGKVPYSQRHNGNDIVQEVCKVKERFHVPIVVSLHWGKEFIRFPSNEQVDLAHELIDQGVDVVLGHHSHVLQGIEEYKNGLIAYSLGNFLFDFWEEKTKRSMILKIMLDAHGVSGFEVCPVYIEENFQPVEAASKRRTDISASIKAATDLIKTESLTKTGQEYEKLAGEEARAFRRSSHKYFLNNIWHYSCLFIIQIFLRVVFRMIKR